MILKILAPRINANDDEVQVMEWSTPNFSKVEIGQDLLLVGTTKATFIVQSEASGYLLHLSHPGEMFAVGTEIGGIFKSKEEAELYLTDKNEKPQTESTTIEKSYRLSKKAAEWAVSNNIDLSQLKLNGLITERQLQLLSKATPLKINSLKKFEIAALQLGNRESLRSSLTIQLDGKTLLNALKAKYNSEHVQITALIVRSVAKAIKEYPRFNSFFEDEMIFTYNQPQLGFAIDTGNGLKIFNLKDPSELSCETILENIMDFSLRDMGHTIQENEISESTFTITDLSPLGILHFQPLINGKQSAILGVGGDSTLSGYPISLTLCFDHRVHTGREAATFLNAIKFECEEHAGAKGAF